VIYLSCERCSLDAVIPVDKGHFNSLHFWLTRTVVVHVWV